MGERSRNISLDHLDRCIVKCDPEKEHLLQYDLMLMDVKPKQECLGTCSIFLHCLTLPKFPSFFTLLALRSPRPPLL